MVNYSTSSEKGLRHGDCHKKGQKENVRPGSLEKIESFPILRVSYPHLRQPYPCILCVLLRRDWKFLIYLNFFKILDL
jgi:hypothetical protein